MTIPNSNSGVVPAEGGVTPSYSIYGIAKIVGEATTENYKFETASMKLSSTFADALTDYNNISATSTQKTANIMTAVNDINIALTVLSVLSLPLGVVALPALGASLGLTAAGEAAQAAAGGLFMQLSGAGSGIVQFSISAPAAALGTTQSAMQALLADAQSTNDIIRAGRNIATQDAKKLSDSISSDIDTINAVDASLGEAIRNTSSAQLAYKARH
jgi:hypothetical protein